MTECPGVRARSEDTSRFLEHMWSPTLTSLLCPTSESPDFECYAGQALLRSGREDHKWCIGWVSSQLGCNLTHVRLSTSKGCDEMQSMCSIITGFLTLLLHNPCIKLVSLYKFRLRFFPLQLASANIQSRTMAIHYNYLFRTKKPRCEYTKK